MSDRSLIADTREAARRAAGQPEPGIRDQIAEALGDASRTHPCSCGSTIWSGCFHPGAPSHEERRADAVLAVVQERLDAKQAEVDAARARCADWEQAHRRLLARCGQLRFAVRSGAFLLRSTADRYQSGQPIETATLRAAAKDLDDMAAAKDPS